MSKIQKSNTTIIYTIFLYFEYRLEIKCSERCVITKQKLKSWGNKYFVAVWLICMRIKDELCG